MRVATAGAVALLAACAARGPALVVRPPRVDTEHERLERARHYEHAMEAWRTYRARVDRVLAPILVESASLCEPKVVPWFGAATVSLRQFTRWDQHRETQADLRQAAARVLGATDGLTLFVVTAGSPAEAAGALPGDVLERVNGREVQDQGDVHDALLAQLSQPPRISLRRGDREWQTELPRRMVCDAPAELWLRPDPFALSMPKNIAISSGMLDLLASDDELAFMLSHELAHRIIDRGHGRPKDVERSADYLGCYLSARAGYDVAALPAFWRRWAALAPFGITHQQTTHPGTSERALLLEATVEEIERKRSAGLPLLPELAQ